MMDVSWITLLKELSGFIDRNKIKITERVMGRNKQSYKVCYSCLNAFIIKKSIDLGIPLEEIKAGLMQISSPIGHNGYYMDGNTVREIDYSVVVLRVQ